jgi:hypothetical protein
VSDDLQKHALECLRLAEECIRLADATPDPALQSHFVRMAKEWSALAEQRPDGEEMERLAEPGPDADGSGSVETN